jgi:peptidoglycan/xylan/chitin deacetylase (PgdA/CDA1 family)
MKVIISHDVDHLTVWEHKKDLIIPKFIIRSSIELLIGSISLEEYLNRFKDFIRNKWNNIEELIRFNKQYNIPATFFFGVNNGLGLSYSLEEAKNYINLVKRNGFEVGVHGIEYKKFRRIKKEFETFKNISVENSFGIRMHYLRQNKNTLKILSSVGYLFDSSILEDKNPYKVNNIWEFPLHIMDGYIIQGKGKKWQSKSFDNIKDETKRKLDELYKKDIKYISILFHDRYFSDSFLTWKNWYIWLIEYLKENKIDFISYKNAIKELQL